MILAVIVLLIGLEVHARYKLKESVHQKWGKLPYQPRFDKEESLKDAWLTEKKFRSWASEVDDLTWYDLDMFEVFEGINLTYSSIGSEALYQRLRSFDFTEDKRLERLIAFIKKSHWFVKRSNINLPGLVKRMEILPSNIWQMGKVRKSDISGYLLF